MKNKFFNINEIKSSTAPEPATGSQDQSLEVRFLQEHYQKINSIKDLVGKPPAPGSSYFLFTEKSFNAFTFIPYLIKEHGTLQEVSCSTYSINKRILLSLFKLINEGKIGHISLLVADSLKHQRPDVTDQLQTFAQSNPSKLKVTFAWNHSKILLVKAAGQHYCIEGSGNWSENSRHEQYIFANNQSLFEFRYCCLFCKP